MIVTLTDCSMREIGPKLDRNATSAASMPTPIRTTRGERIVTIPLPERGELYVRYGDVEGGSVVGPLDGTGAVPAPYAQPAPNAQAAPVSDSIPSNISRFLYK